MEIEPSLFAYTAAQIGVERLVARPILFERQVGERSIDLVSRRKQQWRRRVDCAKLLQQIECTPDVDFEIALWIRQARGDCHLRGKVKHLFRVLDGAPQGLPIANIR